MSIRFQVFQSRFSTSSSPFFWDHHRRRPPSTALRRATCVRRSSLKSDRPADDADVRRARACSAGAPSEKTHLMGKRKVLSWSDNTPS